MKRILVVDDDPDLAGAVSDLLILCGYEVASAENGARALEKVAGAMPDLILLDMKMPVMNGWEFAAELKQRHGDRSAPIVVLTAAADARARAAEIDAAGWLDKPFDTDDLVRTVNQMVGAAEG